MQIPVYKSQLRPTSEAPGARITARMNAQPFVNAALQKGAIGTEIINQVGEYANMRYKMIVETQKNEAIFSAKEALMGLSSTLEKSTDFANIFDGENKYKEGVNGVYDEMRAIVGKNKYALQDFDNSFRQMEIPIKFRLKEVVDIRIEKRRQAALKALQDQQIATLSDPNLDMTVDELAMSQAGLTSIHNRAVAAGGINPEIMGDVSQKILSKALENLIPAYAGTDLNAAIQLVDVLDQISQVRSGKLDASDMQVSGTIPNHVINMLQAVPAEEAAAVVQDTLKMASAFFNAEEKMDDERVEQVGKRNTKAYNFAISLGNTDLVSQERLQQLMPEGYYNALPSGYKDRSLSGIEVRNILTDTLNNQMWASPEQQRQLRKANETGMAIKFAPPGAGNESVYSELYAQAERGMLTIEEINSNSFKITAQNFKELQIKVFNEADESLNVGSKLLSRAFRYNAMQAGDDNKLSKASKAAFEQSDFALQDEFSRRESEGNPMTLGEIRIFAKKQIEEFGAIYTEALREEYIKYVERQAESLATSGFVVTSEFLADPVAGLDAWYYSLSATQQEKKKNSFSIFKAGISVYANQGLF